MVVIGCPSATNHIAAGAGSALAITHNPTPHGSGDNSEERGGLARGLRTNSAHMLQRSLAHLGSGRPLIAGIKNNSSFLSGSLSD